MVDRRGRTRGGYPSSVLLRLARGRIATLARADVAAAIHCALDGRVETVFDASIVEIHNDRRHVVVSFKRDPPREVDLVIGADKLHSRVRQSNFGPDAHFEYPMGCHVVTFEVAGYRPRDDRSYIAHTEAGRYVARFPIRDDKTLFSMACRDEYLAGAAPTNDRERKAALTQAFPGMGWECPAILSSLEHVGCIHFDSISQIRMEKWVRGRVALVGDAAVCPSLITGEGCGFALAEACALADQIHQPPADLNPALTRYQEPLKPFVASKQRCAERLVPSFVQKPKCGVRVRDFTTLLMRLTAFPHILMRRYLHDEIELPDYPICDSIPRSEHTA